MEFITPIVTIIGSLMEPIIEHAGFFFSSTKHVANMRKNLSKLNEEKHDMEEKKKDALINDRLIPDSLHRWLDKVENIIAKIENVPLFGNGCLHLKIRYKADPNDGSMGDGGVGKTTMMEDIKKVVERRRMFAHILKLGIGRKYDPITIQKHIANDIGFVLSKETKEDRVERLEKNFEEISLMGKHIFFILNDVWDAIDLKDIGLAYPFPKGFKLLVTSRNRKVCIGMGINTPSIFEVGRLEHEKAKHFFFETINISNGDDELCIIGEDIINKCRGLPIAIKTVALALRCQKKVVWEVVLDDLQRHNLKDIEKLKILCIVFLI
ncbi:hypothetical protein R6Q57_011136 [Mikania cordata]